MTSPQITAIRCVSPAIFSMLKFAGAPYKVPDNVYVHGFLTALGEKMSKSRGTGISPDYYLDLGLNSEWLRYYIAAKLNDKVEDIDFNPDDFVARVNSDLIGKYVNIASRVAPFLTKYFDGQLTPPAPSTEAGCPVGGHAATWAVFAVGDRADSIDSSVVRAVDRQQRHAFVAYRADVRILRALQEEPQ